MDLCRLQDSLYWSYANLAMAHAAVFDGASCYGKRHFMVRSRLFSGLSNGSMNTGSIVEDERLKLILPRACSYCGASHALSLDHVLPASRGGPESGDNIVWACRPCNSSKGASDLLEWMQSQGRFPPLLLLRRYLKLAIDFAAVHGLLALRLDDARLQGGAAPFSIAAIPHRFPAPSELVLWTVALGT